MISAGRGFQRLGLFAFGIGILAVASLWFVRAAIEASGLQVWGSVALGQAVGSIGAILVGFGWNLSGPTRVATALPRNRPSELADSLRLRGAILPGVVLLVVAACFLFPMIDPWVASVSALPVLVAAVSSSFYFVGTSSPGKLLLLETLPRAFGTAFAALLMSLGVLSAVGGVAVQLLTTILAIMTSALAILGWRRPARWFVAKASERPALGALFRRQRAGVFSGLWTSAMSNSPLLVVSVVSPATLAAFSVIDKLVKQVVAGSSPLTAVLQGWVPGAGAASIPRRVRVALVGAWVGSAFVFVAVGLVARPLVVWTSAGEVEPGPATVLLMAGLVSLFLLQNAISYACLAPLDRLRAVNLSLVVGGVAGIIAIILLVPVLGLDGALLGSVVGLTLTVVMQTVFSLFRQPLL